MSKDCTLMKPIIGLLFLLFMNFNLSAQSRVISGKVIDQATGSGLPGATISVKGSATTTITDETGNFSISNISDNSVLVVSFVGYDTKEIDVGTQNNLNISLESSSTNLNEVVVIGYGTVERRDLTGSVASVSGKDIATTPVPNVAQAMQGKLPGVNIVSQDGRPDADVSIRVRGGGSISQSNQPLILIDGVPGTLSDIPSDLVESIDVLKDASSTAIYGARGANGVILVTTKSAQTGKAKVSYNGYAKFNTPTKYLQTLNPYEYLNYVWANATANGDAYADSFEKLFGIGRYTDLNPGGIENYRNVPMQDMQRLVYNSSTSSNHDLTITSGTDKTKLLLSTNYTDEQGMKINSYLKRANVTFKISQKILDNVTVSLDTRYVDIQQFGDEGTANDGGSLLSRSYRFRPIATDNILGDLDALRQGNVEQYGKRSLWDTYSSEAVIKDFDPLNIRQRLRGIATLNWNIIKGLNYNTILSLNRTWQQRKYWTGAVYNNYVDDATGERLFAGSVDYRKSDSWGMRWTNTLDYDFDLNEDHRLKVLVGQEVSNSGGTGMIIQANHFPSNFDKKTAFAQINQFDQKSGSSITSSSVDIPDRINSYFGRVNYSLLDKYLFTGTFRADGSSKFSPTNRWGYFPAGAFAWRISRESFMEKLDWITDLKIRASYGQVGNDGISSNLWSQTWGSVTDQRWQYAIDGQRQSAYDLASSSLANMDLKWETTITRDLGADFTLFNGKLSGTVDVYWNTTKDLLMLTTIPGITGFTTTYANVGRTSNKGVELSLQGTIFRNNDWNITAGGNINFNKGNIDKLSPNVTGLYGTGWSGTQTYPTDDYILLPGHPVGLVRGLVYEGFYTTADFDYDNGTYTLKKDVPDLGSFIGIVHGLATSDRPAGQIAYPGLPKFKDLDGNGIIDDNDIDIIGNTNPKHTGGFNLSANYKNWDFGVFFNWVYGNKVYNANKLSSISGPKEAGVYENKLKILSNSYKIYDIVNNQMVRLTTPDELDQANVNANIPLAYNEVGLASSLGIEDGSYLRLNTLVLGYTLPDNLLSRIGFNNLRVYGSIYNLFTITGYSGLDPEVNADPAHNGAVYPTTGLDFGTYPRARSFVVGLNLSF